MRKIQYHIAALSLIAMTLGSWQRLQPWSVVAGRLRVSKLYKQDVVRLPKGYNVERERERKSHADI